MPVAGITATKLRWTSHAEPDAAARARAVMLPHDLADLAAVREVLAPREYVALGAARQAAWALQGEEPGWTVARETTREVTDPSISERVRARYADVRDGRAR